MLKDGIDLRRDTVPEPTEAMGEAMHQAVAGDNGDSIIISRAPGGESGPEAKGPRRRR